MVCWACRRLDRGRGGRGRGWFVGEGVVVVGVVGVGVGVVVVGVVGVGVVVVLVVAVAGRCWGGRALRAGKNICG